MPLSWNDLSDEDKESLQKEVANVNRLQVHDPTPAEQWKSPRKDGFIIELPSGNFARVRRTMDMLTLIKEGRIPNPLGAIVQKMIEGGEIGLNLRELDLDARMQAFDLMNNTVAAAMVEPRVIIPPEDINPEIYQAPPGAITIMDLTAEDRLFISQVAQGGTTDVSRFREEQGRSMELVPNGKGISVPPEPTDRPKRASGGSKRKR